MTLQISNWNDCFEGAKSRTYNNKTSCQMPTKHGLGYRRLIRRKNGPALFGAWCALIQVLSRHPAARKGYCTDNGQEDGRPLTPEDLELLTDIPSALFVELFELGQSANIRWLISNNSTDTTGNQTDTTRNHADTTGPSDSDSD
jgi:hypothetical protein